MDRVETLIMMIWMYAIRYPAMKRHGITLNGMVGTRGSGALDGVVEDGVRWETHN